MALPAETPPSDAATSTSTDDNSESATGIAPVSKENVYELLQRQRCARESLQYGIGSGVAVGLLAYYQKRNFIKRLSDDAV